MRDINKLTITKPYCNPHVNNPKVVFFIKAVFNYWGNPWVLYLVNWSDKRKRTITLDPKILEHNN